MKATARIRELVRALNPLHRKTWTGQTREGEARLHVELRDASPDELERLEAALIERLAALPGLGWVRVNHRLGRAVVAHDPGRLDHGRLIELMREIEAAVLGEAREYPINRGAHPSDPEPISRAALEIAADALGLVTGQLARALRVRPAPAAFDLAALVWVAQGVPRIRDGLEERFGHTVTDMSLAIAGAGVAALTQGAVSPTVDVLYRGLKLREARTRARLWHELEPDLCARPDDHPARPVDVGPRPREMPTGPIERYSEQAVFAALGGFGFALAATGRVELAAATIFGAVPKPARMGRKAFATELARILAEQGHFLRDKRAMLLLDRIDTVVVDGDLLAASGGAVQRLVAVGPVDMARVRRKAVTLFDPGSPLAVLRERGWALGPMESLELEHPVPASIAARARDLEVPGGHVLGMALDGRLVALVVTEPAAEPEVRAFADAVRQAGASLVVATTAPHAYEWIEPDRTIAGGSAMGLGIRSLQAEGHGVLFVGAGPSTGLAAADVAVAVSDPTRPTPWEAHVLVAGGLEDTLPLVDALPAARNASAQAVNMAIFEAGAGFILSLTGLNRDTIRRIMTATSAASLLALANSVRIAQSVRTRGEKLGRDRTPWHAIDPDLALERLGSRPEGLDEAEVEARRGPAGAPKPPWIRYANLVADELANPLLPVLATGAGLSALMGSMVDAGMIAAVVVGNAGISASQRLRTERALAALDKHEVRMTTAVRGGAPRTIPMEALVRGDVIALSAGDVVPADARLIEAHGVEIDESSLTGESLPVRKRVRSTQAAAVADRASMVYAGTTVAAGDLRAVVTATGANTEAERGLHEHRRGAGRRGGVERRLEELTELTAPAAALAGLAVIASGLLRRQPVKEIVGAGVSLAVAAIPEGLPLLATLAQLSAAQRLSEVGALVRNPRAVEALGRMDLLCCDKTGTLTEGRIRAQLVSDGQYDGTLAALGELESGPALREVLEQALFACPVPEADGEPLPHLTDQALVDGAREAGLSPAEETPLARRGVELPFEPERGYHACVWHRPDGATLHLKGAPEVTISRASSWVRADGSRVELDDTTRDALVRHAESLARRGLRVLAVARRPGMRIEGRLHDHEVQELELLGFVGFADPIRETARSAIDNLQRAGVRVLMVTGDHPTTASTIARELGLPEDGEVVTGPELDAMDDEKLEQRLPSLSVCARVTPSQKVRIVRAAQRIGHTVGMTGDGANDAPAIRLADVGIALGESATPAAREAADLVVVDGRIETIVRAVVEGRALWTAVRDAVALLVGGNLGEIGFTLLGGLIGGGSPLNARQLMLVNLLTDAAPALAIATRPPESVDPEQLLREGPDRSLGDALDREIGMRAAVTAGTTAATWGVARWTTTRERASTVALLTLVGTQLGQTLAAGGRSRTVWIAGLGSVAALVTVVQTPVVSRFFGCRVLGPVGLGQAIVGSAAGTAISVVLPRLEGTDTRAFLPQRLAEMMAQPFSSFMRSARATQSEDTPPSSWDQSSTSTRS